MKENKNPVPQTGLAACSGLRSHLWLVAFEMDSSEHRPDSFLSILLYFLWVFVNGMVLLIAFSAESRLERGKLLT